MRRIVMATLVLFAFTVSAFAQSNTGNLVGTVSDPSGVVPGATLVVKSNTTGQERTVVASSDGSFNVPQLEVGTYTVTITAPGHKTYTATELKIDVGKDYTLNPTLEVGDIKENVEVVAGADLINSSSGELSTTVSTRQIVELPLNGRNPLSLIQLQAGTSSNTANSTTINGQRSSFTNITRDGINVQDNFIRANAVDFVPDRPNVDDTGEFTIITQNAGAEAGYGASQVQLVTPRGSNEFHGAGYLYNRNSKFAANRFFNNAAGNFPDGSDRVPRPFLNRNQVGFKVSGPVLKDRFFFFVGYEKFILRQSTSATRTILTPSARAGIYTYRDAAGVIRTLNIFAPGVQSLPAGAVPVTGIDPVVSARILANVPTVGNSTTVGDGLNTTGYLFSVAQNQDRDGITLRMDYDISQSQSISGTYSYKKEFLLRPDVDAQQGGVASGFSATPVGFQDAKTPFLSLSWRWSPISTVTNEVRGGYQGSVPAFGSTFEPTNFFLQIPLINNPESGFQTQGRNTQIYNFQDNAVWVRGEHSFRFGGQFQAFRINPFGPPAFSQPTIPNVVLGTNANTPSLVAGSFPGGIDATQLARANTLLGLLGGIVTGINQQFNATSQNSGFVPNTLPARNLDYEHYSFYFSDQWRVTPRLTLNLGLRYELFTAIREPNGLALEPVIPAGADPLETILNPIGTYDFVGTNAGGNRFFNTDKNNFAPVLSFAYSPQFKNKFMNRLFPGEGRTVIRGGLRQSYVNDEFVRSADNALAGNQGLTQGANAINPLTGTTALNARFGALPGITAPTFAVPRTFAQNNALAGLFGTVFAINPNIDTPRTTEYNFSIEREIGWQTALEVRYVGGYSSNLIRGADYNQVEIRNNGFLDDFRRAQNNLILSGGTSAAFNPLIPGSQPLPVFNNLGSGGLLTNATIRGLISAGTPGELAVTYVVNGLAGTVPLLPNRNTGVADLVDNLARYNYNSLQVEIRRRFAQGFSFQANYTFQKTLTDAGSTGQTRFDPYLDTRDPENDYFRADYDTAHVFNLNTIYELPFGRGKRFFGDIGSGLDRVLGGWQVTSIIRWTTGAPMSISDPRGTLNRTARSTRQAATSDLTSDQIKDLIGTFRTPCGVYYIDPVAINFNFTTCTGPGTANPAYFRQNAPGSPGNIEKGFINGPVFFAWDASIIKNIPITERVRFQMRAEIFNVTNRTNFNISAANQFGLFNINSSTFGKLGAQVGSGIQGSERIIQFVGRIEF